MDCPRGGSRRCLLPLIPFPKTTTLVHTSERAPGVPTVDSEFLIWYPPQNRGSNRIFVIDASFRFAIAYTNGVFIIVWLRGNSRRDRRRGRSRTRYSLAGKFARGLAHQGAPLRGHTVFMTRLSVFDFLGKNEKPTLQQLMRRLCSLFPS